MLVMSWISLFLQLKRLSLCWNERDVLEFYPQVVGSSLSLIN